MLQVLAVENNGLIIDEAVAAERDKAKAPGTPSMNKDQTNQSEQSIFFESGLHQRTANPPCFLFRANESIQSSVETVARNIFTRLAQLPCVARHDRR